MANPENIAKVKAARSLAATLRGASAWWSEKYGSDSRCDKKGFQYTRYNDRTTNVFKVPAISFEAYAGYYGNSSVSRVWNIDQAAIDKHFVAALNAHKQAIFDHIAAALDKEADEALDAARKELAELQALLGEAEPEQVPA